MMKKYTLIIVVWFMHAGVFAQASTAKLDELLSAYANQNKFNGTALVAQKGKVLLEKGYGFKDANLQTKNDVNTIFQVGSITKQFTAALILYLQEKKKLSIQDKLGKYFPSFPNADKITIEHLLTHTSGIYSYTNDSKFMINEITHPKTRDSMMALFQDKPLNFNPGSKWSYSNSGYSMLGYIIEKVANRPYEQMMRDIVFKPLKMDRSGFDFTHLSSVDKAVGYLTFDEKNKAVAPIVDSSISYSAGAIYSTVGDLHKWERSLFGNRLLKQESWKMAFTPFLNKYGYGWSMDTLFDKQVMAHGGGIHGFNSNLFRILQDEIVIILLNNKNNPHLSEITKGLAAIVLDKNYEMPKERVSLTVNDSLLKTYVGEYELTPAFKIIVRLENGLLKGQATGQPEFTLFGEKEGVFVLKVVEAKVEFFKGADGKVDKMILYQNGAVIPGKKIK
ncbi:MAG: serine hydrolase [Chitinophagaceae bacterium]